jgi:formate hydrogenlyase subunit 6/NADH:ubiquinone oxidoreductase subunit I
MSKKPWIRPGAMVEFVLRSLFKQPATVNYPLEKLEMPAKFRGKLKFIKENCIGCLMCVRDCPADAIKITKIGDKKFEADLDLGKCVYCAQCVDSCPKKALAITAEFELAQLDRNKLKITLNEPDGPQAEPEKKAE